MLVVALAASALAAVNRTVYAAPAAPAASGAGVQRSVPALRAGATWKVGPAPGGSPPRSATSDPIGSRSGSEAVTLTTISAPSGPPAAAGALTTGARSRLATVISVRAVSASPSAAMKLTT